VNDDITIQRNDEAGRYELSVGGELAAFTDVQRVGDTVVMPHTLTVPAFRGRGLAAQVVTAALDDLLAEGAHVEPTCWFVAEYIEANPQYQPLVQPR